MQRYLLVGIYCLSIARTGEQKFTNTRVLNIYYNLTVSILHIYIRTEIPRHTAFRGPQKMSGVKKSGLLETPGNGSLPAMNRTYFRIFETFWTPPRLALYLTASL